MAKPTKLKAVWGLLVADDWMVVTPWCRHLKTTPENVDLFMDALANFEEAITEHMEQQDD